MDVRRRIVFVLDLLTLFVVCGAKWEAITDYHPCYVNKIYERERNDGPPSPSDPATGATGTYTRHKICEEITQSGAFTRYGRVPVAWSGDFQELQPLIPVYDFVRLYSAVGLENGMLRYEYTNGYALKTFDARIFSANDQTRSVLEYQDEYVFVCLLQRYEYPIRDLIRYDDSDENDEPVITPIYVTKIYNSEDGGDVHRFLFMETSADHHNVMLVEEPAEVYTASDFNVELQYLRQRGEEERIGECKDDPVCKLNIGTVDEVRTFRLCSILLTASYFKSRIMYPRRQSYQRNFVGQIAFQTEAGRKAAIIGGYSEWTLQCWANMTNGDVNILHVTRAYKSNEVFVYVMNREDEKLYPEAWIRNVHLVHELDISEEI